MGMTKSYEIIGFDGLPVKGGLGRKPALVRDPATERYAVIAAGRPLRWVDEGTITDAIERGLATRFPSPLGSWSPDTCVAYIDVCHLATRWGGMLLGEIHAYAVPISPVTWVWCEAVSDALARLGRWAAELLASAERRLAEWEPHAAEERFETVVHDVDRARYCVAAIGEGARPLLRRAAVLLAAAYWRRARFDDERLWRDLAFDFDQTEIEAIKLDAIALPSGRGLSPPSWRDDFDAVRKEEPACI
jgi:hypothetical protein